MVGVEQVLQARERIGKAIQTSPCRRSAHFSKRCGIEAYLKLENLHVTGSFKERGALNRLLCLDDSERERGVITASAGNHAQAIAYHATRLGIPSTVVMPKGTPLVKVSNTRSYGARVQLVGDNFDEAYAFAREQVAESGLVFVPPFDDEHVIAGQGTVALELMEQNEQLEAVIVPIGGGGLIAGIAAAYKSIRPKVRIIGVQTAAVPSMKESVESGEIVSLAPAQTIADGIAVKRPGEITFPMIAKLVDEIVTVDEEEVANAVLLLLEREKTLAEGAAACVLAALLNERISGLAGRSVCLLISGGNIDVNLLSRIIERGLAKDLRLVHCEVVVPDRPGSLARLLQLVAEQQANVIEVHHQRAFDVALGEVFVDLILETRGAEQAQQLSAHLAEHGFSLRLVPPGSQREERPDPWR
ncbi:MAG: threonine ammonia-lyase [Acidobacteria bacterium]|nr:MAG: threonine ammonia-lyase [Acidobacteriota bacterium]REK10197.1 MAG: threonine ammonia-lyase [Acidobacteriota bacterium]